jgi:proline iminopeptidase
MPIEIMRGSILPNSLSCAKICKMKRGNNAGFRYIALVGILLFLGSSGLHAKAAQLYMKAWGNPSDKAIVFLHGGPGYNCASFEISTAEKLAAMHYYVVAYDQRGAARSKDVKAKYSYASYLADLIKVYKAYKLKHALLIGHSFGGTIALKFAAKYPEKVDAIALVGAPIDYPATFDAIRARCREVYTAKHSPDIKYINILDTMDHARLDYATYCFQHAMACGLYSPKSPTAESKAMYKAMLAMPEAKYLLESTIPPVRGFYEAHKYTTENHAELLKAVMARTKVVGIYGAEDGLFHAAALAQIAGWLGEGKFHLVEGASHSVFIDQQVQFLDLIKEMN